MYIIQYNIQFVKLSCYNFAIKTFKHVRLNTNMIDVISLNLGSKETVGNILLGYEKECM